MPMFIRTVFGALFLLALLPAQALLAASFTDQGGRAGEAKPEEQIHITADSLSVSDQGAKMQGQGNVEVQREQMTLKADQVQFDRTTKDMEAVGNVYLDDPEWKVRQADRMQFNLDNETGMIENGELFLERG